MTSKKRFFEKMEYPKVTRAHTYASENADIYRAHDAGQEDMLRDCERYFKARERDLLDRIEKPLRKVRGYSTISAVKANALVDEALSEIEKARKG